MPEHVVRLLLWIDAQLPPVLARWIEEGEEIRAVHVSEIGLLSAEDPEIYRRARSAGAVVMTKDGDLVELQTRLGSPPQVVWLRCGNLRNRELREFVLPRWPAIADLLRTGEALVTIGGT